jgi:hypothetical protein
MTLAVESPFKSTVPLMLNRAHRYNKTAHIIGNNTGNKMLERKLKARIIDPQDHRNAQQLAMEQNYFKDTTKALERAKTATDSRKVLRQLDNVLDYRELDMKERRLVIDAMKHIEAGTSLGAFEIINKLLTGIKTGKVKRVY